MPVLIATPFATNGTKNEIPETTGTQPQNATMDEGFPAITQQPISTGGIPPERADFNGILYALSDNISHINKGLSYSFDTTFATKIGGYPLHAELVMADGTRVVSTIANNMNNPDIDLTGWRKGVSASDVVDASGKTQQEINDNFKTRFVNVADYGASSSKVDNTVAINNAALDAKRYKSILWFNDYFPCTGTVSIPDEVVLWGGIKDKCGFTSTANPVCNAGGDVVFNNLKLVAKGNLRVAVDVRDKNAPKFYNAVVDGRINCINNTQEIKRGMVVDYCDIVSDFESDYDGVQQYDVFTSSGYLAPRFTNNYIDVRNVHRLWKLTRGAAPNENDITLKNSRDILIQGNTIKGTGGKQLIDCYFGTSVLKFVNNHLELDSTPTIAGTTWSVIIDNKTPVDARDDLDLGDSVLIEGNTGAIPCDLLSLQGGFGITQSGYSGNRKNTLKLLNNNLKRTTNATATGFVSVRFYNEVYSSGNTFEIPPQSNAVVMNITSNEDVYLDESDTYVGGCVRLNEANANALQLTFIGESKDITVKSTVKGFDANGAITAVGLNTNRVRIIGAKAYPLSNATNLCRLAHFSQSIKINSLDIIDCDGIEKTGGSLIPIYDAIARTRLTDVGNVWLPRLRGYYDTPPTSGYFKRGDTIRKLSVTNSSQVEWVCTTSGNPATWKISQWTTGSGATTNRPTLTSSDVGVDYFDTTLGKFIKWSGTAWYDQAGAEI